MEIRSFRELQVWQKSMSLAERVYELTKHFPRDEQYGLSRQLKRAAVSIASNIAEGHARHTGNYLNHLDVAIGSEAELQTQLELACRLQLAPKRAVDELLEDASEIGRMLRGLNASVERSRDRGAKPRP